MHKMIKRERDVIIQRKECTCVGERQKIISKGNRETEKEKKCKRDKVEEKKNVGQGQQIMRKK